MTAATPQGAEVTAVVFVSLHAATGPARGLLDRGAAGKLTYIGPWCTDQAAREALLNIGSSATVAGRSAIMLATNP